MAEKTEKKYVITNHRSGKVLASCGGSAVASGAQPDHGGVLADR